jgi:hypothetical protein
MALRKDRSLVCQTIKDNQFLVFFILTITGLVEGIFELVRRKRIADDDLTPAARIGICVGIALLGLAVLLFFLYRAFSQLRHFGFDTMLPLNLSSQEYTHQTSRTNDRFRAFKRIAQTPSDITGTSLVNSAQIFELQRHLDAPTTDSKTLPDQPAAVLSEDNIDPLLTPPANDSNFRAPSP